MGIRSLSTASISTGAKRSKVWDQSAVYTPTAFDSIATYTLSSSTTTVTFSSIPSTYKHLQLRIFGRTDRSGSVWDTAAMYFNGDSGANYSWHYLYGNPPTAGGSAITSTTNLVAFRLAGASAGANVMGTGIVDILDYTSTNKAKTIRNLGGVDSNGSGEIALNSGVWYNASNAISSITLTPAGGTNFLQYTKFALYGIKG